MTQRSIIISIMLGAVVLGTSVSAHAVSQNKKVSKPKVHKNIFELKDVKAGDLVASMRIQSMKPLLKNAVLPPGVSLPPEHNIQIKFSGKVTVTGTYHYYDDDRPFGLGGNVCFDELDKASLRKIPKLKSDGRGVWFCFTNQKQARKLFGKKGSSGKATIVINQYMINSAETEVHNVAALIKVVKLTPRRLGVAVRNLLGSSWVLLDNNGTETESEISFGDDKVGTGYELRTYLHSRPESIGTWVIEGERLILDFNESIPSSIYTKAVLTRNNLALYPEDSTASVERYKRSQSGK